MKKNSTFWIYRYSLFDHWGRHKIVLYTVNSKHIKSGLLKSKFQAEQCSIKDCLYEAKLAK